jgi:CheY-like chemotaxis protein
MKKILFVEDNPLIGRVYAQHLAAQGFHVTLAEDGLEAMKLLPGMKPDFVVLDLILPRMSGIDVLRLIRENKELKDTPVAVFSNSFVGNFSEQLGDLKTEAALVKAKVTPPLLVDVINGILAPGKYPGVSPKSADSPVPAPAEAKPAPEGLGGVPGSLGQEFLERLPVAFDDLRKACRGFLDAGGKPAEPARLKTLNGKLEYLTQMMVMADCKEAAEICSAVEAFIYDLASRPDFLNDSARQTITSAVAFLAEHFEKPEPAAMTPPKAKTALVVDDDRVCNMVMQKSLARVNIAVTAMTQPLDALAKLRCTHYDVLLVDISMPMMDGFEFCEHARRLPLHARTPLIFITSKKDFNSHARSILSGGNDLITKPVLPNEICVKVLMHLGKQR